MHKNSEHFLQEQAIIRRYQAVQDRIKSACLGASRPINSVKLLAVSKGSPIEHILALSKINHQAFAESYLQESIKKILEMRGKQGIKAQENGFVGGYPPEWHFIGNVQSNKTQKIAEYFDWVHSVDNIYVAQRLSTARAHKKLNVCIQVNISREEQKQGVLPESLEKLISDIRLLPNIDLRGLMAIPKTTQNPSEIQEIFAEMYFLFTKFGEEDPFFDTLSMGMSEDLEYAIQAGATCVRVGRAIFREWESIRLTQSET